VALQELTPDAWIAAARGRPAWECWGKGRPTDSCPAHPLLCHLLDVAAVAHFLLTTHSPLALRRQLLTIVPERKDASLALLLYAIALHDFGKYTPAFQSKVEWARRLLSQRGFDLNPPEGARHHGKAGLGFVRDALCDAGVPRAQSLTLARAVTAHHGEFPTNASLNFHPMGSRECGKQPRWNDARRHAVESLRKFFQVEYSLSIRLDHADVVRLAGLTAVADWIGSMEDAFPYEPPQESLEAYWPRALQRAGDAVARVGMRPYEATPARSFHELFPTYSPWPVHQAAAALASTLASPSLILIEAPMGEGKTEAALLLANAAASRLGQQGFYIGLPTKATANQMFGRVRAFLAQSRPDADSTLVLAHGDAPTDLELLTAVYDEEGDRVGRVNAETWFLPKKRTLLAEHGVGTIDQALFGVLRTRHGFVRLYGLSGKTVVLDEVHAYDTFTSTILDRLVEWLAALHTTVVLLSATLPRSRRAALLTAYSKGLGGTGQAPGEEARYPRISTVTRNDSSTINVSPRGESLTIDIERVDTDIDRLARTVVDALHAGGCIGWICNTVARAQAACASVARIASTTPRLLLHARMLPDDRVEREQRVEALLGPEHRGAQRPERSVVIGTQLLEQSLDIDFDLLVSDLAPVDLLLQRAGRLHRHRGRRNRSAAHLRPRLWVAHSAGVFNQVPLQEVARVYAEVIVRETLRALEGRTHITLPDDIEALVEAVYRDNLPVAEDDLFGAYIDYFGGKIASQQNAEGRLLPSPELEDDIFGDLTMPFGDDDDPTVHEQLRAITRDTEPNVQVVCLVGRKGQVYISETDHVPLDLNAVPGRETAVRLARRTIAVSHRRIVGTLLRNDAYIPKPWQDQALLRYRRAVVFTDGVATVAGVRLELNQELGLVIGSNRGSEAE
jgi:CRISPR-associated endonuclease/helicase Cas3